MRGWVYVIQNAAMPGLLKVGFSTRDPIFRAGELASTGIPLPFSVAYDILVDCPRELEKATHRRLVPYREGKEWFRCDLFIIVGAIRRGSTLSEVLTERWHLNDTPDTVFVDEVLQAGETAFEAGGESAQFPYLIRAASLGDVGSIAEVSGEYSNENSPLFYPLLAREMDKRLFFAANELALTSCAEGHLWLGRCFRDGIGVSPDARAALNQYRLAANSGSKQGCYEGALLLLSHKDFQTRRAEAIEWLERSDHPLGLSKLAGFYERGEIIEKDVSAAIKCFERLQLLLPSDLNQQNLLRLRQLMK
jgi:hypothetical protein